jgi:Fe-S cluster assembly scaffold protein SufB
VSVAPLALPWASEADVRRISDTLAEPSWLLEERMDALATVAATPSEPNQLFTPYLDLRAVDFAAIEIAEPSAGVPAEDGANPPDVAALVRVDGGRMVARSLSAEARSGGLIVTSMAEAAREHPDLLRHATEGGRSTPADDAFGQVARALSSVGVFIHVPGGVSLRAPIVVRWTDGPAHTGIISRAVISLGQGAHARILEEQVGAPDADATVGQRATTVWWGTTEIDLADGATVAFANEQDFGPATAAFITRQARLGVDASISWANASVGGRFQRSRIENLLEGRGSSVDQVEVGFGDGRQLFDLTSYTRHRGEDTTSDLLSKGVFAGSARGYIKGLIEIARSAKGTDTFLGEFSMLLERTARSVTIPSLEIDQPDVRRAMHSSSVGPIDETQVFYLMSRGLSREQARKAIVLGFLEPVVARIPLTDAQDRLRTLLERKWPEVGQAAVA